MIVAGRLPGHSSRKGTWWDMDAEPFLTRQMAQWTEDLESQPEGWG